jgi:hypothetical protein
MVKPDETVIASIAKDSVGFGLGKSATERPNVLKCRNKFAI